MSKRIISILTVIMMLLVLVSGTVYADVMPYSIGNVQISAGSYSTSVLNCDGTVMSIGPSEGNTYNVGQLETSHWANIVQLSSSFGNSSITVGLKADGTVVGCGYNSAVIEEASEWTGISKVAASANFIIGLKADGTVVATSVTSGNYGQTDGIEDLENVVDIAVGLSHSVFLHSDGTVTLLGNRTGTYAPGSTADWTDIKKVVAGTYHTIGLKSDGTVVGCGYNSYDQLDVADWTDIVDIGAGLAHTVGLKADGTVVAVGRNSVAGVTIGTCNVLDWENIIAVDAGYQHTVGLKSDGTVVIVVNDDYGQCDAEELGKLFDNVPSISMRTDFPENIVTGDAVAPTFSFYNYTTKSISAYIITVFTDGEQNTLKRVVGKTSLLNPGDLKIIQSATAVVPDGAKTLNIYILDTEDFSPYVTPYITTEINKIGE